LERKEAQHHIDGVFVLLLFSVFAVCILLVLLTGARSYRALTARDSASFDKRTCVQYVAAKVRHADCADGVFVGSFDGTVGESGDTLFLRDGDGYETRIYWYDGAVRELYAAQGESFSPEDGDEVLSAQSLSFSLHEGLLTVAAVDDAGTETTVSLALRSGSREAAE
jgi:hypothetical protein